MKEITIEDLIRALEVSMHTNLIIVNEGTKGNPDYVIRGQNLVASEMRMYLEIYQKK